MSAESLVIECLDCDGSGFFQAAFKPIRVPCRRCGESGKIPAAQMLWHQDGQWYKALRLSGQETLRDAAKRLNLDVMVLSDAERGCVDPHPILKDKFPKP